MLARLISLIGAVLMTLLLFYATLPNLFRPSLDPDRPLDGRVAPAFEANYADRWINSEPLEWEDLRGKVVLIDIWAFECWNCYRSFPWVKDLQRQYGKRGLQVIGVHTPELDEEHNREKLEEKVREFELDFPILTDNQYRYWRALENRYWPSWYLVDKSGHLRQRFVGETHTGDANDKLIRAAIEDLLAE